MHSIPIVLPVVGGVLIPGAKAPKLVRREDLKLMKKGSVIVDVAIDQGGCVETIKATTHENPTYVVDGVIHYGVANMPGGVPRTSTLALTNATLPYILDVAAGTVKLTIHMHVRRYTITDIPTDPKEVEAWCLKLYQDKDAMLEEFFKVGTFPGPEIDEPHVHTPQKISEFVQQRAAKRKEAKSK